MTPDPREDPTLLPEPAAPEASARLAVAMHAHVEEALREGLPLVEVAQAIAMLGGALLSSAYPSRVEDRRRAARVVADAAVAQAAKIDGMRAGAPGGEGA